MNNKNIKKIAKLITEDPDVFNEDEFNYPKLDKPSEISPIVPYSSVWEAPEDMVKTKSIGGLHDPANAFRAAIELLDMGFFTKTNPDESHANIGHNIIRNLAHDVTLIREFVREIMNVYPSIDGLDELEVENITNWMDLLLSYTSQSMDDINPLKKFYRPE